MGNNYLNLTNKEKEWLKIAMEDKENYRIVVDNDFISIDECIDKEIGDYESVFTFSSFGEDLLVKLFNYLGCNAEKA